MVVRKAGTHNIAMAAVWIP